MHRAFLNGDAATAQKEQAWKLQASAVFRKYNSAGAERVAYKWLDLTKGLDLGPPRMPVLLMNMSLVSKLKEDLNAVDFFTKSKL